MRQREEIAGKNRGESRNREKRKQEQRGSMQE
jgi:hypothetical protein